MKFKGVELKAYIGDSVYMDFDGFHFVLTTENGHEATNTILLETEFLTRISMHAQWIENTLKRLQEEGKK